MPSITPIAPEGTITVNARTAMPSQNSRQAFAEAVTAPKVEEPAAPQPKTPEADATVLKQRLFAEKMKRQLDLERRKLQDGRRQLDIERQQSRKWSEANELVQQGRYLEAAQHVGLTYDQLTQQLLNGGNIPPAKVAETTATELIDKRFKDFETKQSEAQKAAQTQQLDEARKQIRAEAKYILDASQNFPLAKSGELYDDVVEHIESEFHRTGRIVPVEEALKKVEADAADGLAALPEETLIKLIEKLPAEVLRKALFKEESPTPRASEPSQREVPSTLSQRQTAPIPGPKPQTDQERREKAKQMLNAMWKEAGIPLRGLP